jgi:Cu(I)/Ag(I) efflux system membrane fusion protein
MFVIADLSTVWVQADLYERDLLHIRVGQKCSLTIEAMPGRTLHGIVDFISPVVDETTRTAKVRLKFDNRDALLKPGMYGTVEVTHELSKGLALPEEALIDTGKRKIVSSQRAKAASNLAKFRSGARWMRFIRSCLVSPRTTP